MGISTRRQVEYDDEINMIREAIRTIIYIIAIIGLTYFIIHFIGQRTDVIGHSMQNTLNDGDVLWTDKLTYRFQEPERYDIVIFPYADSDKFYIKRIIGLPGESVYIDENGFIYIDGKALQESYGKEVIDCDKRGIASDVMVLGADEYFVLGDNRNNSQDSRKAEVGPISRKSITGKALFRIWPLNQIGKLQ